MRAGIPGPIELPGLQQLQEAQIASGKISLEASDASAEPAGGSHHSGKVE